MKTAIKLLHAISLFACIQLLWFAADIKPMQEVQSLIEVGDRYWGQ